MSRSLADWQPSQAKLAGNLSLSRVVCSSAVRRRLILQLSPFFKGLCAACCEIVCENQLETNINTRHVVCSSQTHKRGRILGIYGNER